MMKIRYTALLGLLLAAPLAQAAGLPDAAALISVEQHVVGADGVTKDVRYQDRWLRSDGHIWRERVVPANAQRESAHAGHDHHKLDFSTAAMHVWRDNKGQPQLAMVRRDEREQIRVGQPDCAQAGFDGSWETAATLFDARALTQLKRLNQASPVPGAVWYGQQDKQRYLRVLWSPERQLALRIESGALNGSDSRLVTVKPQPLPAKRPWQDTAGYKQRDYMDLLD